jgi:hypothetical protein
MHALGWLRLMVIFWIFLPGTNSSYASDSSRVEVWDSHGQVDYRPPPSEQIEDFRNNKAYKYDREGEKAGLMDRILGYLFRWLQQFFSGVEDTSWIRYLFIGLLVLLFVLLILRLLNVPLFFFLSFSRKEKIPGLEFLASGRELETGELERMLELYRENGAYREAVRVLYLLYLKKLEYRGFVRIRTFKTNREYCSEITDLNHRDVFKRLSRIYEFIWFGQFNPDQHQFETIEKDFNIVLTASEMPVAANG